MKRSPRTRTRREAIAATSLKYVCVGATKGRVGYRKVVEKAKCREAGVSGLEACDVAVGSCVRSRAMRSLRGGAGWQNIDYISLVPKPT